MKSDTLPKILIDCSLSNIADFLRCPLMGNDIRINGFNLCNREIIADSVISYCAAEKYLLIAIKNPKVKAIIVTQSVYDNASELTKQHFSFIISETPEWSFYKAFIHLINITTYPIYDWEVSLDEVTVGEGAIIERGVKLGKKVTVGSNSVVKSGSIIGDNVHIGSCSVIGGEGFQLIKDDEGKSHAIPHIGRTYIGNDVFIGDNTTIAKSLFEGYTYIDDSVKIDNHCHVAHNCIVGENSVLTACVTLFGSCIVGKNVWLAPNSSVMNRVKVGDGAFVCASSFVMRNVKPGDKVFGVPANKID